MTHAVRVVAGEGDVNGAASRFWRSARDGDEIRYDARLDLWKRPRYRILIGWMGKERGRRALDGVGGHSLTRKGGECCTRMWLKEVAALGYGTSSGSAGRAGPSASELGRFGW